MNNPFFAEKSHRILGALALVMLIVALASYARYTWKQSQYMYFGPTTIQVVGEGEVTTLPDVGEFSFAVKAEGETATEAQEKSAIKMNAILSYLKDNKVEDKDIKTEGYNLSPKYRYEQKPCTIGSYCPGEQVEDGFSVNQTVRVKVRAIDQSGDLIAGVGDKGATNISGLSFTIDDESKLKSEARTKAIADAKNKAEVLADQLDVKLVKMTGYYEDEGYQEPYYYARSEMAMNADSGSKSIVSPQMPQGENMTKSRITITYQIEE